MASLAITRFVAATLNVFVIATSARVQPAEPKAVT